MEMSPSWEAASRSAAQEFSKVLLNLKVHYLFTRASSLVLILSQMNSVHTNASCCSKIYFNIILNPRSCLQSFLFTSGFLVKIVHEFSLYPMCAISRAHLILLGLTIPILLREEYKLWSSSLCSFWNLISLHLSSDQIFFEFLWNTLSLFSTLNVRDQVQHLYKTTGKTMLFYILIFIFLDSRREHKSLRPKW
jgi:hypothetical protein